MSERRLQEPSAIKLVLVWDMGHTLKDRSSNIVAAPSKIRICTDYFEHGKGSTFSLNILYCELEASRAKEGCSLFGAELDLHPSGTQEEHPATKSRGSTEPLKVPSTRRFQDLALIAFRDLFVFLGRK